MWRSRRSRGSLSPNDDAPGAYQGAAYGWRVVMTPHRREQYATYLRHALREAARPWATSCSDLPVDLWACLRRALGSCYWRAQPAAFASASEAWYGQSSRQAHPSTDPQGVGPSDAARVPR
jgi:hypothetical protein